MKNYDEAVQDIMDFMVTDYNVWKKENMPSSSYEVHTGRSYDKIVKICGFNASKCVVGFICKKENPKKGFKVGDMLMPAGWNAPATNFSRGNIFEKNATDRVTWTGIY